MQYFLEGLLMGLAYVAPIGLQNLFVINTAISQKRSRVYATAFIVIFFDVTLALACFFGIGAIMEQSHLLEMIILLVGSIIVVKIGVGLLLPDKKTEESGDVDIPILKVILTACVVTWFNPQALIDGSMMLGAFNATLPPEESSKFIIGVACASCLWFLSISTILTFIGAKITDKILRIINVVCGVIIIFYGIKLFINFIQLIFTLI